MKKFRTNLEITTDTQQFSMESSMCNTATRRFLLKMKTKCSMETNDHESKYTN